MILVKTMGAQGDVLFRRVQDIPRNAEEQAGDAPIVVSHSEMGHHHVVASRAVKLLTTVDPLVSYLRIDGPYADVVHQRPWDTHETLRLLGDGHRPTYFEVRQQREHTQDSWRRLAD